MKSSPCEPGVGQSFAVQLIYPEHSGVFAEIAQTIGRHGGDLGHIDLLGPAARLTTRGISIRVRDAQHLERIVAAVRTLDKVKVVEVSHSSLPVPASRNSKNVRVKSMRARRRLQKGSPIGQSAKGTKVPRFCD